MIRIVVSGLLITSCWGASAQTYYERGEALLKANKPTRAVQKFHRAADLGLADAQYRLGRLYASGKGVVRNVKSSEHYFSLAAQQKNSYALYRLARIKNCHSLMEDAAVLGHKRANYQVGLRSQDPQKAFEHFKVAAENKYAPAEYQLALCYFYGKGVEQDITQADIYFNRSFNYAQAHLLKQNGARFQCALARLYERTGHEAESLFCARQAASQGSMEAYYMLGQYYLERDFNQAIEYIKIASGFGAYQIVENGVKRPCRSFDYSKEARPLLEQLFNSKQWVPQGEELEGFRRWAAKNWGRLDLRYIVGLQLASSDSGFDRKGGFMYLLECADKGYDGAQDFLERKIRERAAYNTADSNDISSNLVLNFFERMAHRGDRDVQLKLAKMYENGGGVMHSWYLEVGVYLSSPKVPQDMKKALHYYDLAKEQGSWNARFQSWRLRQFHFQDIFAEAEDNTLIVVEF